MASGVDCARRILRQGSWSAKYFRFPSQVDGERARGCAGLLLTTVTIAVLSSGSAGAIEEAIAEEAIVPIPSKPAPSPPSALPFDLNFGAPLTTNCVSCGVAMLGAERRRPLIANATLDCRGLMPLALQMAGGASDPKRLIPGTVGCA
jgi:hypothetical protein